MDLGFVVNSIDTVEEKEVSTKVSRVAVERGHKVWYITIDKFSHRQDERTYAKAHPVPSDPPKGPKAFLNKIQKSEPERIDVSALDVLWLRYDPSKQDKAWTQTAPLKFAKRAAGHGVIVLNEPDSLKSAHDKFYLQDFPVELQPHDIISSDYDEIRDFIEELGGEAILKPLQGSEGRGIHHYKPGDPNLKPTVEHLLKDGGYVMVQEYLSEARGGDIRFLMMNGHPLKVNDCYAAFRRVPKEGETRSNIKQGGKPELVEVDEAMLRVADLVRPKLVEDGMFFVGLDIVMSNPRKLMEVNVWCPGGINNAEIVYKRSQIDFTTPVVEALERKVLYAQTYADQHGDRHFNNNLMNTL